MNNVEGELESVLRPTGKDCGGGRGVVGVWVVVRFGWYRMVVTRRLFIGGFRGLDWEGYEGPGGCGVGVVPVAMTGSDCF